MSSLYTAILGMLTPIKDYVTGQNTAVVSVKALSPVVPSTIQSDGDYDGGNDDGGSPSGRRLLSDASW